MISGGTGFNRTNNATISIITVVYNNVKDIESTILSVLNQSKKDFEYIIIDGGSTDGTLEIIQRYNDKIDFWLSDKDKGIYDAMNKGLSHAKGDYVWFMNSGDKIAGTDTLEKIFKVESNADVYYGETLLVDVNDKELGTRSELTTRKLPAKLNWKDMKYGMVVSHQSIIVKRTLADFYDLTYRCSADINWVISSLKKAQKIVNANSIISRYMMEGFSIKNRKKCWNERFNVYKHHYGLIETLFIHAYIIIRYGYYKLLNKPNF